METLRNYVRESFEELRYKMTWPTWKNLQQTTGIVLIGAAVLALLIFLMDALSNQVTHFIYK
jgi:preprotein translocase subunit SecE